MVKNLENAIFVKYNKHIKLSAIAKISGLTQQTLYEVNKNPNYNLTIRSIEAIYKATKLKYGKGLRPWDYLKCVNFCKETSMDITEEDIVRQIALEKIRQETINMEAIHEEHKESMPSAVIADETAAAIMELL